MIINFLKILGVLSILLIGFLIAGFTGALFYIWPTWVPNEKLIISDGEVRLLVELKNETKFKEEQHYPGAMTPERRVLNENIVNSLLEDLIKELPKKSSKSYVLGKFKETMRIFPTDDTEDMERLLVYMERILEILHIKSSNELLCIWRYGLPYGWFER